VQSALSPSPEEHDLVVIGASAGGVETLQRVVAGLPSDLPAAVLIVLHLAPTSPSALAQILNRAGSLPCRSAVDGEDLRTGEILVAPPDRHLVVEDGVVRLTVGPRENGHRPAVDVLFRSAAQARDGRCIGVVLSGTRDDGAAGLAVIKAAGGATVVQDPKEALYGGMPRSALAHVAPDAVVPSTHIAQTVVAIVNGHDLPPAGGPAETSGAAPLDPNPFVTVCPECGGVLTERTQAGVLQWECRVGHRYSAASLIDAQAEDVEAAMWAAIRILEDRQMLLERLARHMEAEGHLRSARSFARRAAEANAQAQVVRASLAHAAASDAISQVTDDDTDIGIAEEDQVA
jgi:two-component system, chemotaxis family, protein-glutamate methylesterase/glutaminase